MKKMLLFATALVMVFGLMTLKCGGGGQVDYYPVGAGWTWTYKAITIDFDSSYKAMEQKWVVTSDTITKTLTTECVAETTLDDSTAVWEFKSDGTPMYMAIGEDVVEFYLTKADTAPSYTMPKELKVGSTWETPYGADQKLSYKADSTVDVVVPAGTFKGALKVSVTYPEDTLATIESYEWWDKDEGIVKSWEKKEISQQGKRYWFNETTTELTGSTKE